MSANAEKENELNITNKKMEHEEELTWGEFCNQCCVSLKERTPEQWGWTFLRIVGVTLTLYFFLFSLDLMGSAFKVLGGCSAGSLFSGISNPIAGLMVGVLATVLVQSSSTSTSIVVSMVGSGSLQVTTAIPVIMGANIGTSVTNTLVSMGQIGDPDQFERAFAGATVHDMFNFLSVAILLPIEAATHLIFHLTKTMIPEEVADGEKWEGPVKAWVGPFVKEFINVNKDVTTAVAKGTTCESVYGHVNALNTGVNMTTYDSGLDFKYGLIKCSKGVCPLLFTENASQSDDMAAGFVALFISLLGLTGCLLLLVKLLQSMVLGTSESMLKRATSLNSYLAMLVGAGITILVQSSSVTTSVLTPLVGVGVLPVEKMFPLTLGANVGTTCTALLASLVSTKPEAVQIALCHLFFNLIGTAIWFPIPFMRQVPLNAAKGLGSMTRRYTSTPLFYILFAFVIVPVILLGISSLYDEGGAWEILGVMITIALILFIIRVAWWWRKNDGRAVLFAWLERREAVSKARQNIRETHDKVALLEGHIDRLTDIIVELKPGLDPVKDFPEWKAEKDQREKANAEEEVVAEALKKTESKEALVKKEESKEEAKDDKPETELVVVAQSEDVEAESKPDDAAK